MHNNEPKVSSWPLITCFFVWCRRTMHLTSCVTVTAIKNGSLRDSLLDREGQSSCESLGPGVNPLNYDDTFVNFSSGGLGVGVGIDHYYSAFNFFLGWNRLDRSVSFLFLKNSSNPIRSHDMIRLWDSKEMLHQRLSAATTTKRYIKHSGLRGTIKWRENTILEPRPFAFSCLIPFFFFVCALLFCVCCVFFFFAFLF